MGRDHQLAEMAHRGHGGAGADLHHDRPLCACQPGGQPRRLGLVALARPAPVAEHQQVGPGQAAAAGAGRQRAAPAAGVFIDLGLQGLGRPRRLAAAFQALQPVQRAVAFMQRQVLEPGALELPVDIAGEHRAAVQLPVRPLPQQRKAGMRHGAPVQRQPVAVEAPGEFGVALEGERRGHLGKVQPRPPQGRVGAPEALAAAEVRQAGVHTQAGAGGDHEGIGLGDEFGRGVEALRVHGAGSAGGLSQPARWALRWASSTARSAAMSWSNCCRPSLAAAISAFSSRCSGSVCSISSRLWRLKRRAWRRAACGSMPVSSSTLRALSRADSKVSRSTCVMPSSRSR
mmetsp:Transcript_22395/g.88656  ORF Transcript_22395/g.88656 Transcript_22395/m.88656 type:complete len:344 (+) Transcript_22395:1797-2828(+)